MKNLRIGILAFGLLGVISLFIPSHGFTMFGLFKAAGMSWLVPVLGGFALATIMGILGMTKPPLLQWQAGVAAAGFVAVFVRLKFWELLKDLGDAPVSGKLMIVSVLGGLVVSILALVKPESNAS